MKIPGRSKAPEPPPDSSADDVGGLAASTNPERSIAFAVLAAFCGFALIVLPYLSDSLSVGLQPFRWPMLVVGLAAIAAALGSQAVAKYKLFSAGGTAAIVVIFASVLAPKATFVYGNIRGTEKFPSAVMVASSPFLVGRLSDGGHFHFFAREEEINGPIFSITARNAEGAFPQQIIIGCIPIDLLKQYLGNSDGLDLTMSRDGADADNPRWKLVQTRGTAPLGQWGNPTCEAEDRPALKTASLPSRVGDAFVPSAWAVPVTAPPSDPLKLPDDVEAIFRQLEQGDFASQVRTQDRVARLRDAASIGAVVREWKAPWKPQVDTGLVVAWVRGIRLDRGVAVPLASGMSQAQLDHLVELAGGRDQTVRYNATELLSWMLQSTGWPNPPPAAQSDAILNAVLRPFADTQGFFQVAGSDGQAATDRANSAYNAMVALSDAKCVMQETARTRASTVLTAFAASAQVQTYKLDKTSAAASQFQKAPCR